MPTAVCQVIGCGLLVVTGTGVGSLLDEQLSDGGMAGRGSLMEGSAVILSHCVHLGPTAEREGERNGEREEEKGREGGREINSYM